MRAVVIADGASKGMEALIVRRPAPMLPLVDRPFLQHVIETLVDASVSEIDIVLSDRPEQIEEHFGDGRRWGCSIRYHLVRQAGDTHRYLQSIGFDLAGGPVWIAQGNRLPVLPALSEDLHDTVLLDDASGNWTGWTLIQPRDFHLLAAAKSEQELGGLLCESQHLRSCSARALSITSSEGYLSANQMVLAGEFPNLLLTGKQTGDHIWISRSVSMHPTAQLQAPVFVGENCRIGAGVKLGPGAVVGDHCVLDRQCSVSAAVILAGSYVGEDLEVNQAIVDRNQLASIALGTSVTVTDNFLIGGLSGLSMAERLRTHADRIVALALLLLFWPILLGAILRRRIQNRTVWVKRDIVRLPAGQDPVEWRTVRIRTLSEDRVVTSLRHFCCRFLPGLIAVIRGRLALVGTEPRTVSELQALPAEWRSVYLGTRAGLITESFVRHGAHATEDELYACEAYYRFAGSWPFDMRLLLSFGLSLLGLTGPGREQ